MPGLGNSNKVAIDAADLGVNQTSAAVELNEAVEYSVQCYWSAGNAVAGSLVVEGTNDDPEGSPVYAQISMDAISANSGSLVKTNDGVLPSHIRVKWVRSAGSGGVITCKVSVKRS